GNYVVNSSSWNDGRGALTWGDGNKGVSGVVSETNSLVGSNPGDYVGESLTALSNGNYVVDSPYWNGRRGAATWGDGRSGLRGSVSDVNSLVGSNEGDYVCPVLPLSNGNYLIQSLNWNGQRGAVTWGNGRSGVSGIVSAANSLVGS